MKYLDLIWEEPYKIDYDRATDKYHLSKIPDDLLRAKGLYQIYGRHPVYGENVLLYIGETKNERSFKERLNEHIRASGKFYFHTNLSVSLCPSNYPDELIQIAESILIVTHKPALNKKHLDFCSEKSKKIMIRNWGFVRSLQNEASGLYHM